MGEGENGDTFQAQNYKISCHFALNVNNCALTYIQQYVGVKMKTNLHVPLSFLHHEISTVQGQDTVDGVVVVVVVSQSQ